MVMFSIQSPKVESKRYNKREGEKRYKNYKCVKKSAKKDPKKRHRLNGLREMLEFPVSFGISQYEPRGGTCCTLLLLLLTSLAYSCAGVGGREGSMRLSGGGGGSGSDRAEFV